MREILLYSIPFIVLASMAGAIYYLSLRVAWAFEFNKWFVLLIVGAIVIGSFVAMMVIMQNNYTSTISHIISNTSNIVIGVLMFAVCATLLLDAINLIVKIPPRTFGLLTIGLTTLVSLYSIWNASHTRVYHRDISLPNLSEPLRIAHLSDTHFGHFWGENRAQHIVDLVMKEDVDAIVITGDMFDGRVRLNSDVLKPFQQLRVPIYFSEGNHDGYSGSRDIKNLLSLNGIIVLDNKKVELNGTQIIGLDYLMADAETADTFHAPPAGVTMKEMLPTLNIDKNRASILLHHNPVGARYAAESGINLYLAGHTHAGQLFPATLISALMFEYNKGLYKYDDNMQIYVSQGIGTFGPPMRLGTQSELTIINLMKQ